MTEAAQKQNLILSLKGISKNYGAVSALENINLDIFSGDVVALCGDNGAGKSSLIKIISGAEEPTLGTLSVNGREVHFSSPQDALKQGVATIYQDLALAPRLSIYENIFMGTELTWNVPGFPFLSILHKTRMKREAISYLKRLSIPISDANRPIERLSGGQRQAVAICRALLWNAKIIIMDEPTAALGVRETAQVNDLIRSLRDEGRTVILISHNMVDVAALASRVVILSKGQKIVDQATDNLSPDDISHMILQGTDRVALFS